MDTPPQSDTWQVDPAKYPNAQRLVDLCGEFLSEIQDLTPSRDLEEFLNKNYGLGNKYYDGMAELVKIGIREGWAANTEIDGPNYRRSKVVLPSDKTRHFSLTTVWMDSQAIYSGEYHKHVYGEINCVIPVDEGAEMRGMQGWQSHGWTSPGAGTHHYPQVRLLLN
jgi:hypothetical protein